MPAVLHVLRRGAVYYWRRRFPAAPGSGPGGVLIVSLGTKDQDEARRLSAVLTHMSEPILAGVRRGELSRTQAQAIMLAVAQEQIETLKRAAIADRARSRPEPMSGARADRILGAAYKLLAERGRAATLGSQDEEFLLSCGLAPTETLQVQTMLEVLRRQKKAPAPDWTIERLLARHAPDVEMTALARTAAETAFYRAKAAACLDTDGRWSETLGDDIETIRAATGEAPAQDRAPSPLPNAPGQTATAQPAPPASAEPATNAPSDNPQIPTSISGLAQNLLATRSSKNRWTIKTGRQMRSMADLLIRVVGHDEFTRLRQNEQKHRNARRRVVIERLSNATHETRMAALRLDKRVAVVIHEAGHVVMAGRYGVIPERVSLPAVRSIQVGEYEIVTNADTAFHARDLTLANAADICLGGYCGELAWLDRAKVLAREPIYANADKAVNDCRMLLRFVPLPNSARLERELVAGGEVVAQVVLSLAHDLGRHAYDVICLHRDEFVRVAAVLFNRWEQNRFGFVRHAL